MLAACAPTIESPEQASYQRDLRDATRAAAQLEHLPHVRAAHVTLSRAIEDPLRVEPPAPSAASVVLVVDDDARAAALADDARAIVLAIAPELPPERVTVLARAEPPPIPWVRVGPFRVAPASRRPLLVAACALLALCAVLGVALALRERSRRGPRILPR